MPEKERDIFIEYLKSKDQLKYYEFGSGGSTYVACQEKNVSHICSQESDTFFYNKLKKMPVIMNAMNNKLTYVLTEVGCNNNWGYPKEGTPKEKYLPYFRSIRDYTGIPDLVLIDGRFRVACALNTWFIIDEHTIVLFDDFSDRSYYHIVLKYFHVINIVGRMAVFKKNVDVTMDENDLEKYETDPR